MEKAKKEKLNLTLDPNIKKEIIKEAFHRDMTASGFVTQMFKSFMDEQEKMRIAKESGIYQMIEDLTLQKMKEIITNENDRNIRTDKE